MGNTAFKQHQGDLNARFPGDISYRTRLLFSDVLAWSGPGSFPDTKGLASDLLRTLRICRGKLASDRRDKVFGILGVLPEDVRAIILPDYSRSVREVYTDVVDYLLHTTERFDVVCEATAHTSGMDIPSWVPDWSHDPPTSSLGPSYKFDAAPDTRIAFSLRDRRSKLSVSAIYLDAIKARGITVGTACQLDDFLMAFRH